MSFKNQLTGGGGEGGGGEGGGERGHNLIFLEALRLRDWIIILPEEDIVNQRQI